MTSSSFGDRFAVFLQEACLRHQYIRSKDTSNIVERPERLRAVNVGISAALSRLKAIRHKLQPLQVKQEDTSAALGAPPAASDDDDLTKALEKLNISSQTVQDSSSRPNNVIKSSASVNLLNNAAVKFVHGDIDGDVYLESIIKWAKESRENIKQGVSEIPRELSQGDLYLCPTSIEAMQGALGTTCEAVDSVIAASRSVGLPPAPRRAFVSVRPPGHHCGEQTPCGFCFVNNVAVGAAHAHLKHGINRVVIVDIDLHHGNGTQSIVWQINEETYRQTLEAASGSSSAKPGPQVYYGSIHDVLSFPCEGGKPELVQAASVSIHGPHGQFVENIHLETYNSDEEFFDELYAKKYSRLLTKAADFLDQTGGPGDDVLVFISCGFDACEHENKDMQRHQRRVPTTFYHRFTHDACTFADQYARGRMVSVLEGGYSDRALTSGVMAHLAGLAGVGTGEGEERKEVEEWWKVENLVLLEQATKKRRGGRVSQPQAQVQPTTPHPEWLQRTLEIFSTIDTSPPATKAVIPASSRSLRQRPSKSTPSTSTSASLGSIASTSTTSRRNGTSKAPVTKREDVRSSTEGESSLSELSEESAEETLLAASASRPVGVTVEVKAAEDETPYVVKKLPRVILKLGPRDGSSGIGGAGT
ncbi:hypothetical protein EIP91_006265 [Steccherinum ochraceum]|uniref:Histone deacetylase domain-containing protein n=1 Tax=Steccherinum ochraceum TaxID=92696 RepID=A0A4R0R5Y3_9APHY|nr:hypothetical protein EIP91_006265 [Steccherinum ochraceum]